MFRWFFFCNTGSRSSGRMVDDNSSNDPCSRLRLLCWAMLCTVVWGHISLTLLNFVAFVSCTACLSLILNLITDTSPNLREMIRSVCNLSLVIGLISAAAALSSQAGFLRYEYLIKKMALKEYDLWRCRCSSTYITLAGVTVISCVVRGIHKRKGL